MSKEKVTTKSPATKKEVSQEPTTEKVVASKPAAAKESTISKATVEKPTAAVAQETTITKPAAEEPAKSKAEAAKKAAAKPAAAKKPPAKKEATPSKAVAPAKEAKATSITKIMASVDVGYGNSLYLRGEGGGLSWDKGMLMDNAGSSEWSWSTDSATDTLVFKFLINDEIWSVGDNLTVAPGETSISTPSF
jgi:membrane protein involved in colicin uptake